MPPKNLAYKGLHTAIFLGGPILMIIVIMRLLVDWNLFVGALTSGS